MPSFVNKHYKNKAHHEEQKLDHFHPYVKERMYPNLEQIYHEKALSARVQSKILYLNTPEIVRELFLRGVVRLLSAGA